ncbi:MAG: DUF5666 domain-containing protein [Gemmatimonadaceae bacterium]
MIGNYRPTSRHLAVLAFVALATAACGRESGSGGDRSDTAPARDASAGPADTAATVRGTVASVSPTELVIRTDTSSVTVKLTQPFQVYDRGPGNLADVRDNSFVGVTTVKQPDGSEQATEIHIFPDELRGLGEGSRMMTQNTGGGGGRMTNGAVSASRMTNGTASPARMSNGNVASANGPTLVVQYAGGSQKITVPPKTPVTEIKPTSKTLAAGDRVVILAKKDAGGLLSASKGLLAGK